MSEFSEKQNKPCHVLKYCPYGPLVEDFPLRGVAEKDKRSCSVFGHDCPVFTCAGQFIDKTKDKN